MPIEYETHFFNEVTYIVDYLKVKALMMIPKSKKDIKRIVIYLRGGKGQVGRVESRKTYAICKWTYLSYRSIL